MTNAFARSAIQPVPGDGLLHPVAIAGIGCLILNDHVLKAAAPGFVTGKLSDFAGLLFFPLLLQAVQEVARSVVGKDWGPSQRALVIAIAVTALTFAAVKLVPEATTAFASALGAIQWLAGQILMGESGAPWRVEIAQDPTDLIALPVLVLTFAIGSQRSSGNRRDH